MTGRLKLVPAWLLLLVLVVMASVSRAVRTPESNQLRVAQEQSSGALNTYYFKAWQPQVEVLPSDHIHREGTTRLRISQRQDQVGKSMPVVTASPLQGHTHNVADTWSFLKVLSCGKASF